MRKTNYLHRKEGVPELWESMNEEECDGLISIIVGGELINVVVSPTSRQLG